jgi:hypothetical protein
MQTHRTLLPIIVLVPLLAVAMQQTVHTDMQHAASAQHGTAGPQPVQPGQGAFAAISEIVRLLEADSSTDWSKVNIEALRQHLIDMDLVTLRSSVRQSPVTGGVALQVTGDAQVAAAIQRMVTAHAAVLNDMSEWSATTSDMRGGVRLTVVARSSADSATVNRIRGLGFIGLMVQGDHHTMHHLMIARGAGAHAHGGQSHELPPGGSLRPR